MECSFVNSTPIPYVMHVIIPCGYILYDYQINEQPLYYTFYLDKHCSICVDTCDQVTCTLPNNQPCVVDMKNYKLIGTLHPSINFNGFTRTDEGVVDKNYLSTLNVVDTFFIETIIGQNNTTGCSGNDCNICSNYKFVNKFNYVKLHSSMNPTGIDVYSDIDNYIITAKAKADLTTNSAGNKVLIISGELSVVESV